MVAPGGVHGCSGGHVWLLWGGVHGCSWGACMVAPGGHAWLLLGVCAWDMTRYGDTINEQAVRILLECILVDLTVSEYNFKLRFQSLLTFCMTNEYLCERNFVGNT